MIQPASSYPPFCSFFLRNRICTASWAESLDRRSRSHGSGGGTAGRGSWTLSGNGRCESGWRLSLPHGCDPCALLSCERVRAGRRSFRHHRAGALGPFSCTSAPGIKVVQETRCRLRTPASLTIKGKTRRTLPRPHRMSRPPFPKGRFGVPAINLRSLCSCYVS